MALRDELFDLLRRDPALREELRRHLLTEELLGLPAVVRELAERVDRLTERVDQLAHAQRRTEDALRQLTEGVGRLTVELERLIAWQRGEASRRRGDRFERDVVRRAPVLFNGGQGGSPDSDWVRQRLTEQLRDRLAEGLIPAEEDPFLADLLWWKGEQVAVVDASVRVNGTDLARAVARTATLAQAGAQAFAVVIGEGWAKTDTARQAATLSVEWKVGDELSAGFLIFRRRAA